MSSESIRRGSDTTRIANFSRSVDPAGDGNAFPSGVGSSIGNPCYLMVELARKNYESIIFRDEPSMGLRKVGLLRVIAFAARPEIRIV